MMTPPLNTVLKFCVYVHMWNFLGRGFLAFIRFSKKPLIKKWLTQTLWIGPLGSALL